MNYLLEVIRLDGNTSPIGRIYLLRYKAGQSTTVSFPKFIQRSRISAGQHLGVGGQSATSVMPLYLLQPFQKQDILFYNTDRKKKNLTNPLEQCDNQKCKIS